MLSEKYLLRRLHELGVQIFECESLLYAYRKKYQYEKGTEEFTELLREFRFKYDEMLSHFIMEQVWTKE